LSHGAEETERHNAEADKCNCGAPFNTPCPVHAPKLKITTEQYFEIRRLLPGSFEEYSSEFIDQMIFDINRGFPPRDGAWLSEAAQEEFEKSPRAYMIAQLKEERDGVARVLEILGVKD